jgi:uroporphyrinogen III methyltransferase/synthase
VEALFARLAALGLTLAPHSQIAAVGPGTAAALAKFRRTAELMPSIHRAEDLAAELAPRAVGKRILLVRGEQSRGVLAQELAKQGSIEEAIVYRQRDALDRFDPAFARLARGEIDFVTLTSSNIARAFLQSLDRPCRAAIDAGTTRLVSISPITSATIRELSFPVAVEARRYSIDGMMDGLVEYVRET